MGTVEIIEGGNILISSHIITYGNAADETITERIRNEIEAMWNEPHGTTMYRGDQYSITFKITAELKSGVNPEEIMANDNPLNNYFRIEEFAHDNISFVDGLGCNTGYFKLENLYEGSTTAAHEYGHTLGLDHPTDLDLRGRGIPGIMYPRGTLVDLPFQYDPSKPAGVTGGTMHPMYRKVKKEDIALLKIHKIEFNQNIAILGNFSSVWHPDHSTLS
jgi:hypothetical protein